MKKEIFPIGLGTNRFKTISEAELEESVLLVLSALDHGVNYIDVAPSYSRGNAERIVGEAIRRFDGEQPNVTLKVSHNAFSTADKAYDRARLSLKTMMLEKASHFVCWNIMSLSELDKIRASGGVYDAALLMKREGLIEHISFSTHASPAEIFKIMECGLFDGVTISMNVLNAAIMQPVVKRAGELGLNIFIMNPLAGGVLPQNSKFFRFLKQPGDNSVASASLKYLLAYPEITCVLNGVSNIMEIEDSFQALERSEINGAERVKSVQISMEKLEGFCTGCDYCSGCPQDIPVSAIMRSRNSLLFDKKNGTYHLCRTLQQDFQYLPDTPVNPCIHCGLCEEKCTQRLKICDALEDSYNRMKRAGFSQAFRKTRLHHLLYGKDYRKVGFYPAAGYTTRVLEIYYELFGEPPFECILFDGNPSLWGKTSGGLPIYAPCEIAEHKPNCIVISSWNYGNEIYKNIKKFQTENIDIVKLHESNDVPWVF